MRKISGHVVSTKASTLSRAAEIVSGFAAVDTGSSTAVALYLQLTADAFNHLAQFHDKRSKLQKLETSRKLQTEKSSPNLQINVAEKRLGGIEGNDLGNKVRKKVMDSNNLKGDEAEDVKISVKKKKKRRKSDDIDVKEINLKGDEADDDLKIWIKKKKKKGARVMIMNSS